MSFDTQLKERLDSAAESMPGEPLDLMTTLSAARRERRLYRTVSLAAAALVLIAGGVGAALMIGGPEENDDRGKVVSPGPQVSQEKLFDTVADFLAAINLREPQKSEAMWELLSPVSKAYFDNDPANFDPVDFSGETLGAYDFATERTMHLFFLDRAETLGVVTVTGTVTREGFTEQDGFALPIRVVDGEVTIELFSEIPYPEARVPDIGAQTLQVLASDPTFAVRVTDDPRAVRVIVWEWDSPRPIATGEATSDGDTWSWTPDEPLAPGTYVVTFAVTSRSGEVAAAAEPFVVE
ncbi:MAG: hypothetical protein GEU71_17940 [Actinobacteria bacterium]|nr:hypothetical protein [Actinomycetota bacterium]